MARKKPKKTKKLKTPKVDPFVEFQLLMESFEKQQVTLGDLNQKLYNIEQRIDRIVAAISTAKPVKEL